MSLFDFAVHDYELEQENIAGDSMFIYKSSM